MVTIIRWELTILELIKIYNESHIYTDDIY